MIAIVDYGLGNLGSIVNMLKKVGHEARIITQPAELEEASKIILPGVGAFDTGMRYLKENNWIDPLNKKVLEEKVPVLGICLGMQLMTGGSEEGALPGLNWVRGYTRKFAASDLRIPHMGWNLIRVTKPSTILPIDSDERRFYFVHSYCVQLENPEDQLLETVYGEPFTSGFQSGHIVAVQFHPEKSHRFGQELLNNFAANFN
jgi:glutamine amidotransferase